MTDVIEDSDELDDDDELDGCEVDMSLNPTSDEEVELMPMFAEALDPNSPVTVEQVGEEWRSGDVSNGDS